MNEHLMVLIFSSEIVLIRLELIVIVHITIILFPYISRFTPSTSDMTNSERENVDKEDWGFLARAIFQAKGWLFVARMGA